MKWWTIINKNKEAKEACLSLGGGSRVLCWHEADKMSNFGTSQIMAANSDADGWSLRWVSHNIKTHLKEPYCHWELVPKVVCRCWRSSGMLRAIFSLPPLLMASVYNFIGIICLDDGIQFMPADKRHYWTPQRLIHPYAKSSLSSAC